MHTVKKVRERERERERGWEVVGREVIASCIHRYCYIGMKSIHEKD
jgi:hypothetical protein